MRKNALTIVAVALFFTTLNLQIGLGGQEVKDAAQKVDNRAQALKKFLEAQSYEKSGNFSAAVAASRRLQRSTPLERIESPLGRSTSRVAMSSRQRPRPAKH